MSYFKDVRAWHKGFDLPVRDTPVKSLRGVREWERLKLVSEEYDEFVRSIAHDDREETLDAIADMVFVLMGTAVEFGWDFDEAWSRVCESNWTKLGLDGRPIVDEHGKIKKGPNFRPPDLEDLV